jgi:hypothetical protein
LALSVLIYREEPSQFLCDFCDNLCSDIASRFQHIIKMHGGCLCCSLVWALLILRKEGRLIEVVQKVSSQIEIVVLIEFRSFH